MKKYFFSIKIFLLLEYFLLKFILCVAGNITVAKQCYYGR